MMVSMANTTLLVKHLKVFSTEKCSFKNLICFFNLVFLVSLRIIESRIFCYVVFYDLCYNVIWNFVCQNISYFYPSQNISTALCTQAKNLRIIFLLLPKVSAKNVFFFWHELSQNVMDNLICHSEMSNFFLNPMDHLLKFILYPKS